MPKLEIDVGQVWRTRALGLVRVITDRTPWAVVQRWRWGLSNGHMVDDEGRAELDRHDHPCDLIERLEPPDEGRPSDDGMDSTGGLS